MPSAVRSYREVIDGVKELGQNHPVVVSNIGMVGTGILHYPVFKIHIGSRSHRNPYPRSVFIAAGIHGNEPGGVWAALEFSKRYSTLPDFYREFEFTILPCTNPYGYEYHIRENAQGLDLNRQFRAPSPPVEVQLIKETVGQRAYLFTVEFHEDVDSPGFYLYEMTGEGEPSWGREIISCVAKRFPINLSPKIEGLSAQGGLISRRSEADPFHQIMERQTDWSQALYHYANGTRHCITTEAPVFLTREERSEIHLMALDVALKKLWEQHVRPSP